MIPQHTQTFVPLTAAPALPAPRDFAVTVIANGEKLPEKTEKKFQSLETQRPVAAGKAADKPGASCEPHVAVQRDGGRVTHLRITCTCGQVMDLACLYEQPA